MIWPNRLPPVSFLNPYSLSAAGCPQRSKYVLNASATRFSLDENGFVLSVLMLLAPKIPGGGYPFYYRATFGELLSDPSRMLIFWASSQKLVHLFIR